MTTDQNSSAKKSSDAGKSGLLQSTRFLYGVIVFLISVILAGTAYWSLRPASHKKVKITDFVPTGEVPQTTNFTLTFSQAIVPDSLLKEPLPMKALRFTPELPGEVRWIRINTLRFYPEAALRPSTRYKIQINEKWLKQLGFVLTGKKIFSCHTQPLQVKQLFFSWTYNRKKTGRVRLKGTVRFNYIVKPAQFSQSLILKLEKGNRIPVKIKTTQPAREIVFLSRDLTIPLKSRKITVRVRQGLTCVGGELGLPEDFVKTVTLRKRQEFHVNVCSAQIFPGGRFKMTVTFNQPVSVDQIKPFISISPSVDFRLEEGGETVHISGPFSKETAYLLTLKKGLPSLEGGKLRQKFEQTLVFKSVRLEPQISWTGSGYYLSRKGHLNLGLETVNISHVSIRVEKVYVNNLVYLLSQVDNLASQSDYWFSSRELGKTIVEMDTVVALRQNQSVVTPISAEKFLKDRRGGIFKFTAWPTERGWSRAIRWVLATDMGILAKRAGDALWVWVNSIATLNPVADAEVKLYSRNNQVLLSGTTNSQGVVIFRHYKTATDGFEPFVLTASTPNDFSFLSLLDGRIPISDFDVGGLVPLKNGYAAYLYPERDIYRPGETVHLAVVVRDADQKVPEPFPVRLRILSPGARLVDEQKSTLNEQGGTAFNVKIPRYLPTGRYLARLYLTDKQAIGETFFHVEEFLPDRMKVTVQTDRAFYFPGQKTKIAVEARTLLGTPAANRIVRASLTLEKAPFLPKMWRSFTFKDARKTFKKTVHKFRETRLNAKGGVNLVWQLPDSLSSPAGLKAVISATVLEPGGRAVTRLKMVPVHPAAVYVGLKQVNEGYAAPNKDFYFEALILNPQQKVVPGRKLRVDLYRVIWESVARSSSYSGVRYQSVSHALLVNTFYTKSQGKPVRFAVKPNVYGDFRVVVTDEASGAAASADFYSAGWGYVPWAMGHPGRIELEMDKKSYQPGEEAKVLVRSPIGGRLLLTVEGEGIYSQHVYQMKKNTAEISMPVEARFKPNVYISAHIIRSPLKKKDKLPIRAFGVAPLFVSTKTNRLEISLNAPKKMRPGRKLPISFQVRNAKGTIYATVAVVDEGICQLTDFKTPDPMAFFFGKRKLTVDSYDLYGNILPEVKGASSPSGGLALQAKRHLTLVHVKRVKPVAFWSGLLKLDSEGRGQVTFKIPEMNGSLRIMVVAFSGSHFGNLTQQVLVRNPIVVTPTFPRFLARQDDAVIPVSVLNGTGKEAQFTVRLTSKGPVRVAKPQQELQIPAGKEKTAYFEVSAGKTFGKASFLVQVTGGGEKTALPVELPVRPATRLTTLSGNGVVHPNKPAVLHFNQNFLTGTARYSLVVSGFPTVKLGESLRFLLHYPYGCAEQTVSGLFPLLYFKDLAQSVAPELFEHSSADYFIGEGILKLERLQTPQGQFSYWPGTDNVNKWASVYASHFLVEAKKLGYAVPNEVYRKMLKGLKTVAQGYTQNDRRVYERAAYACYVLALAGRPQRGSMNYLKNNGIDQLPPDGRFFLAGAFSLIGDVQTAHRLLPKQIAAPSEHRRQSGANFYSDVRAEAVMLLVLEQIEPDSPVLPNLIRSLFKKRNRFNRWYTTQENAFALLALGKALHNRAPANFTGTVRVDGQVLGKFGTKEARFSGKNWAGKTVQITTKGTGSCYYYWRASGMSTKRNFPEKDHDLIVRRTYLTEDGKPIPYNTLTQGDLVVAEISLKSPFRALQNVAVVDLLPAGLEIENPRLQSREAIHWIGKNVLTPKYLDIRDDRLQIFVDLRRNTVQKFYYALRAVTEGKFFLPAVQAEAMYVPEINSAASSGQMRVVGASPKANGN